jgi:hypothetical protein
MGIDQIFLRKQEGGGRRTIWELMIGRCAWRSDRVCACVETMRCEAMRLDSSGSYKKATSKPSAERSKRRRRPTNCASRRARRSVWRSFACTFHVSLQQALYMSLKLQHAKFCLKRFCQIPSELFLVLGRVFDNFGNILQMCCQFILQYQSRILSYHIISY